MNMSNADRTELKNGNCSHLKTQMGHAPQIVHQPLERASCASLLGAQTQSPWDRAPAQGLSQAKGALQRVWGIRDYVTSLHPACIPKALLGCRYDYHLQRYWRSRESYTAMAPVLWEKIWRKAGAAPSQYCFWWYRIKFLREESSELPSATPLDNYCLAESSHKSVLYPPAAVPLRHSCKLAANKNSIVQRLQC